jgi:hypothetical protein
MGATRRTQLYKMRVMGLEKGELREARNPPELMRIQYR